MSNDFTSPDEWIRQNLDAIDLLGPTEAARLAYVAGQTDGVKAVTRLLKEMPVHVMEAT